MRRTTGEPLGRNFALPSEQTIQKDEYRFSALWSNGEDFHWSTHEISGSRFVSLDEAETLAYYLLSDFAIKVERLSRKLIRFVRGGKV